MQKCPKVCKNLTKKIAQEKDVFHFPVKADFLKVVVMLLTKGPRQKGLLHTLKEQMSFLFFQYYLRLNAPTAIN